MNPDPRIKCRPTGAQPPRLHLSGASEIADLNTNAWLTVREAALLINASESMIRRLLRRGALPRCRLGKAIRISREALDYFMRSGGGGSN